MSTIATITTDGVEIGKLEVVDKGKPLFVSRMYVRA